MTSTAHRCTKPMPITIRGKTFPTQADAARFFDVTPGAVSNAKARDSLERLGLSKRGWKKGERGFRGKELD